MQKEQRVMARERLPLPVTLQLERQCEAAGEEVDDGADDETIGTCGAGVIGWVGGDGLIPRTGGGDVRPGTDDAGFVGGGVTVAAVCDTLSTGDRRLLVWVELRGSLSPCWISLEAAALGFVRVSLLSPIPRWRARPIQTFSSLINTSFEYSYITGMCSITHRR